MSVLRAAFVTYGVLTLGGLVGGLVREWLNHRGGRDG